MGETGTKSRSRHYKTLFNFKRKRSLSCVYLMGSQALCFVGCVKICISL